MNISDLLDFQLFSIFGLAFTVGQLLGTALVWAVILLSYRLLLRQGIAAYFKREGITPDEQRRIRRVVLETLLVLALLASVLVLGLDTPVLVGERVTFRLSLLFKAVLVVQLARLSDWVISQVFIHGEKHLSNGKKQDSPPVVVGPAEPKRRVVQPFVYVLALFFIINSLALNFTLFSYNKEEFRLSDFVLAVLIILGGRLLSHGIVRLGLAGYYQRRRVNPGSQYAVNQLLSYLIFIISFLMALQAIGIQPTVLLGGAAALLVGIGLGLQQTFNDLVCGLLLLFERTVEVGDVVQVDNMVGTIKRIGLRTSLVDTRENITVIVPNSKLVGDRVINWSHNDDKARFFVSVGVAYGSDTALVRDLLTQAAIEHPKVLKKPQAFVRFTDFGDSALQFQVFFWTKDLMPAENVKSDIRFRIDELFRAHDVKIPFPQRDVWMRGE